MVKPPVVTNVRAVAAQLLTAVIRDSGSLAHLMDVYRKNIDDKDQALFQELVFGTLRWQILYSAVCQKLMTKTPKSKDHDILSLLWLGMYQLSHMRVPEHAVVNETVKAASQLKIQWAKGLINGVLRRFIREQNTLLQGLAPWQRLAAPQWLYDLLACQWPEQLESILSGWQAYPPFTLRVSQKHYAQASAYNQRLAESNIVADHDALVASAITLNAAVAVDALPGFKEGHVSVQDAAAQLAAPLLLEGITSLSEDSNVLDACAAPGGKTCHLLELMSLRLTAIDSDPKRLLSVQQNLNRLGLDAQLTSAQAQDIEEWWDGDLFDAILLDAPCSGTGVIRRHPDIKHLRRSSDIDKLTVLQAELLDSLWQTLKPNGVLLYATCSVLQQENEQQIQNFIIRHNDALVDNIVVPYGIDREVGWQILPGSHNLDGFFYARLRKAVA